MCCNLLQLLQYGLKAPTATHCNTLQHTATHRNTPQHTATHRNTPQHTTTHRNTPQHTATHRNTPQHTATRVSTQATAQSQALQAQVQELESDAAVRTQNLQQVQNSPKVKIEVIVYTTVSFEGSFENIYTKRCNLERHEALVCERSIWVCCVQEMRMPTQHDLIWSSTRRLRPKKL